VTHIVCDSDAGCLRRASELRACAGNAAAPLVRRAWLSDSIRAGALRELHAYLIDAPAPATPAASALRTQPRDDADEDARCDACRGVLESTAIRRCLRCMSREPASVRVLHLRYRADHPHNRQLVAAFDELYECEVRFACGVSRFLVLRPCSLARCRARSPSRRAACLSG
jgi:hypothetical protein